jgi:hypothetical protein
MSIRVENQTRYSTEDLQALVDFCCENAPASTGSRKPDVINFFEFRPKKPVKAQRVNRYLPGVSTYGPDYLDSPVKWVKTERTQVGVVWIAAPECWLSQLAQLTAQDESFALPPMAVRLLADAIKTPWHFSNVPAELTLSVRVTPGSKKPGTAISRQIIRRNRFVTECEGWVTGLRNMRTTVSTMDDRKTTMRTRALDAGVADPFSGLDTLDVIGGMVERLDVVEQAILRSLENMRKQEEGK